MYHTTSRILTWYTRTWYTRTWDTRTWYTRTLYTRIHTSIHTLTSISFTTYGIELFLRKIKDQNQICKYYSIYCFSQDSLGDSVFFFL